MFFKALRNLLKCAFCTKTNCSVRYQIGDRNYYSGQGFVSKSCPKTIPRMPEEEQEQQTQKDEKH